MKPHAIARAAARARKAYATRLALDAEEMSHKARQRLERRTRAARRAVIESERAAEAWADWADA